VKMGYDKMKEDSFSYPLSSILNLSSSWYNAYTGG